jgi:hypothetical protein
MRKIVFVVGILFLINCSLYGQSAIEIARNWLPSTLSLVMEDNFKQPLSLGSGFIIGNGKVVTNLHVIEGAKFGSAFASGSSTKHKIEGYFIVDKQNDLVILSVPTLTGKAVQLALSNPEIGERIYAIGNPKGLAGSISEGIVSGIRDMADKKLIQITAPISPGSSGGPVLNNKGEVIGVAVGTLNSGQNLNFAVPSSKIKLLAEMITNTITSLNIFKALPTKSSNVKDFDIKEGILIRDWKYIIGVSVREFGMENSPNHKVVKSISFFNMLPHRVKNIKVLFILYDKRGIPIDYFQKIFFYDEVIEPFLGKKIDFSVTDWMRYKTLVLENGENIVARILDFQIIEE